MLALPIVFASDRLVAHPVVGTTTFNVIFALACAYGLGVLLDARRERPRLPLGVLATLDVAFICALTYESGSAFAQLQTAFLFLPLGAAVLLDAPRTMLAVGMTAIAYLVVALVHPTSEGEGLDFVLVQCLYLIWVGIAAAVLASMLARRRRRIVALAAQRSRLLAEALAAEDRARQRLADELHDNAVQNLLAARQDLAEAPTGGEAAVRRAEQAIGLVLEQLRDTVRDLHPAVLGQLGLRAALRDVGEQQARRGGYDLELRASADGYGEHDGLILSLVRELLANVTRHARAGRVTVELDDRRGFTQLRVTDDGAGFDPDDLNRALRDGHVGLASCRERVSAAAGTFEVQTSPGRGTAITCRLPREGAEDGQVRRSTDHRSIGPLGESALAD